jgi:glyoxylase-like metal-dependent hydrolase (beta-lactamase superfamily II)
MKRVLKWVGVVVAVLAVALFAAWYSAFGTNKTIVDGQVLVPGVTVVKNGFVSMFVLDAGPGKVALVDAGRDTEGKAILAALSARGMTPASVAAIFLTHWHPDHTAAAHLFPGAKVYLMEPDVAPAGDSVKVTNPLKDGDVVDVGDLHVEAFATPGHTAGSAVYFARGVLFFGDSAGATSDGEVKRAVRLFSKDSGQNLASLKALAARLQPRAAEVKVLAFAHTGPLDGFGPLATFAAKP